MIFKSKVNKNNHQALDLYQKRLGYEIYQPEPTDLLEPHVSQTRKNKQEKNKKNTAFVNKNEFHTQDDILLLRKYLKI